MGNGVRHFPALLTVEVRLDEPVERQPSHPPVLAGRVQVVAHASVGAVQPQKSRPQTRLYCFGSGNPIIGQVEKWKIFFIIFFVITVAMH